MSKLILTFQWGDQITDDYDIDSNTRDTIHSIEEKLKKKYSKEIGEFLKGYDNVIRSPERNPLTFSLVTPRGQRPLGNGDFLISLFEDGQENATVYWTPDTIGGNDAFLSDVNQLKSYRRRVGLADSIIQPIDPNKGLEGLGNGFRVKVCTNPSKYYSDEADVEEIMRDRRLIIKPESDYPETPPVVTCNPEFTDDPCWRNGVLAQVYEKDTNMTVWSNTVNNESSETALIRLFNLLVTKYGIVFKNNE